MPNLPDTASATPEQTAAAKDLLAKTIAATTAYRDPAAATKAGFDVQAAWDRKQKKLAGLGKAGARQGRRCTCPTRPTALTARSSTRTRPRR